MLVDRGACVCVCGVFGPCVVKGRNIEIVLVFGHRELAMLGLGAEDGARDVLRVKVVTIDLGRKMWRQGDIHMI